jgi:membrane fusion protein (multidrug efflux system)
MQGWQNFLKGLVLFGCIVFISMSSGLASNRTKVVEVINIKPGTLTHTMRLIGTLKAKNEWVLVAKSQGTVGYVIPAGTKVKKGDLVLSYSCCLHQQNVDLMQKAVGLAQEKYNRAKTLFDQKVIAKVTFEQAHQNLLDAQKRMTDASLDLEKTQFIAPFDGVAGVFKVRTGAQVAEGDVLGMVFDPSKILVTFDIPGTVLQQVKAGQKVLIDNHVFALTGVQQLIDPHTHMAPAYLEFSCDNCVLGSHVDLDLVLQQKDNIHVVPLDALVLRGHQQHVFVIQDDVAKLRKVITGLREKEHVEITQGLKNGDVVVSRGTNRLYDGIKVKIAPKGS